MTQRLDYQKLSAAGVRAVGGVYMYVMNSGLPKTLLDLVFLRASQINGCAYCIDSHSRDLRRRACRSRRSCCCRRGARQAISFPPRRRPPCGGPRR